MNYPFDITVTDHLLSTTRAVRKRLDYDLPVEPEVITDALRLASQAPSAGDRQSWRWVVVTDPDLRRQLGDLYRAGAPDFLKQDRAVADAGDPDLARRLDSVRYLLNTIERAPALVIPCIVDPVPDFADLSGTSAFFGSIYPAIWSFQLALRSRGLGSVLTLVHLNKARETADLLGIPYDVTQIALLPVAYTKGTDFKPANREPVETLTYWNGWRND